MIFLKCARSVATLSGNMLSSTWRLSGCSRTLPTMTKEETGDLQLAIRKSFRAAAGSDGCGRGAAAASLATALCSSARSSFTNPSRSFGGAVHSGGRPPLWRQRTDALLPRYGGTRRLFSDCRQILLSSLRQDAEEGQIARMILSYLRWGGQRRHRQCRQSSIKCAKPRAATSERLRGCSLPRPHSMVQAQLRIETGVR